MTPEMWALIAVIALGIVIFVVGIVLKGIQTLKEVNDGTFEPKWKGKK